MAWVPFDSYMKNLFIQGANGVVDWDDNATTDVKVMLIKDDVAPVPETHDFVDDLDDNEVSGTGYTATGNVIASKAVTVDAHVITVDADNPATWSQNGAGFTDARYALLYKDSGTPATSPLIAYADLGGDKGNVAGDLTIEFDALGIFTLAAA
jgi:hypothetical protein